MTLAATAGITARSKGSEPPDAKPSSILQKAALCGFFFARASTSSKPVPLPLAHLHRPGQPSSGTRRAPSSPRHAGGLNVLVFLQACTWPQPAPIHGPSQCMAIQKTCDSLHIIPNILLLSASGCHLISARLPPYQKIEILQ